MMFGGRGEVAWSFPGAQRGLLRVRGGGAG